MPTKIIAYNAYIIENFATRLYAKANWIIVTSTVVGAIVGAIIGGIGGAFAPRFIQSYVTTQNDPLQIMQVFSLILGVIGALSGYSRGREKAFRLRLEAQVALCQVQIEKNTSLQGQDKTFSSTSPLERATGGPQNTTPPLERATGGPQKAAPLRCAGCGTPVLDTVSAFCAKCGERWAR